jgi:opacity protein-like surface antigen
MKTKLTLLASSAVVALSLATPAQAAGNFYVSVFGGGNWVQDETPSGATTPTSNADTVLWATDADTGFIVGGAIGMSFSHLAPGLRAEVEAAYRQSKLEGQWRTNVGTPTNFSSGTIDGDHSTFSVLANIWYDFDIGGVSPYVGGGIGWAETSADGRLVGDPIGDGPFDFSDNGFAWQVGAGINFDISPNIKLGLGYRYFEGPDVTIHALNPANSASADMENSNHTALVSLTFGM